MALLSSALSLSSSSRSRKHYVLRQLCVLPLLLVALCPVDTAAQPARSTDTLRASEVLRACAAAAATASTVDVDGDGENAALAAAARKHPSLTVLGFVTPWHTRGQDVSLAQSRAGRLHLASPASFALSPSGLVPDGGDAFADDYATALHAAGARVVPRVRLADDWTATSLRAAAADPAPLAAAVARRARAAKADGLVLEGWAQLRAAVGPPADGLLRALAAGLRAAGLSATLVLPPVARTGVLGDVDADTLRHLGEPFDYVVVMTYDYSTPGAAVGPIAPLPWVRSVATFLADECGLAAKLLLGLNLYGVDFARRRGEGGGGDATHGEDRHVIGEDVVKLLQTHGSDLVWMEQFGEHAFTYEQDGEQHAVFYPTARSVGARVALAAELGCAGVALWELGQGMDYLFDEL